MSINLLVFVVEEPLGECLAHESCILT